MALGGGFQRVKTVHEGLSCTWAKIRQPLLNLNLNRNPNRRFTRQSPATIKSGITIKSKRPRTCGGGRTELDGRICETPGPARQSPFQHAFTLIELLTVIAIIGILATLLSTSLVSAKRKARQTTCIGNLHQIALAMDLYLDDHGERPPAFETLVATKYLPNTKSFRCPEDKTGDWGSLVENPFAPPASIGDTFGGPPTPKPVSEFVYSYLSPLPWEQPAWDRLNKVDALAGVAVCQLHGVRRWKESPPSLYAYEGLVLRAQRDGAVVRRHLFWPEGGLERSFGTDFAPSAAAPEIGPLPWPLFTDKPAELLLEP